MPEFAVQSLLKTPTVTIRDVFCQGSCRHQGAEECATATQLVFPYRGVYVRHLGHDQAVAEANQVLFFNGNEGYRVSHPVPGGDASLTLAISEPQLRELAPPTFLRDSATLAFRQQHLRIDARAQALVALLRHSLRQNIAEPLEAESLALTLAQRTLGPRTTHAAGASLGRQRLVDRVKLVLASDLSRRWTLAEIAAEVRGSAVYLTQVFQQVEGLPLYRYQLRLRLARALDLLAQHDDLTTLSLDLGFSSHSHFSAAFRQAYGRSPSEFRRSALHRWVLKQVAKDSDSDPLFPGALLIAGGIRVFMEGKIMIEKTCAACDCKLDGNVIEVKLGGKTVEVCCDECAQKLKEAHASIAAPREV